MEKYFFIDILASFGIEALIPKLEERDVIHNIIYDEFSTGNINPVSKKKVFNNDRVAYTKRSRRYYFRMYKNPTIDQSE
jgi:aspartate/glutamate racemase